MRPLSSEVFIVCAECPSFVQCLECFSAGAEKPPHLRTHSAAVTAPLSPAFPGGWCALDELLLLHAISVSGYGNWSQVARATGRSADDCRSHYSSAYLRSGLCPRAHCTSAPSSATYSCPTSDARAPFDFNTARGEFGSEHCDDAELLLKGLSFDASSDDARTFSDKLQLLRCYSGVVRDRAQRRRVASEWRLHERFAISLGASTAAERSLDAQFAPFVPYVSRASLLSIAGAVRCGARVREQLLTRAAWRAAGAATAREGALFQRLSALVAGGAIAPDRVREWNSAVSAHNGASAAAARGALLSGGERALCAARGISERDFLAIRRMIVSECALRGRLSRAAALRLDPERAQSVGAVYDHLRALGIVSSS